MSTVQATAVAEQNQAKVRSKRRHSARPFLGDWMKHENIPLTPEEEAIHFDEQTEILLRPICRVLRTIAQVVEEAFSLRVRDFSEDLKTYEDTGNLSNFNNAMGVRQLEMAKGMLRWYDDVPTNELEERLARSPIFRLPTFTKSGSISGSISHTIGWPYYGCWNAVDAAHSPKVQISGYCNDMGNFLLDRPPKLPILERRRLNRCIESMEQAAEKLPKLIVEARAARVFEIPVLEGIADRVIELDKFFNVAHEKLINFGKRHVHLGCEIYQLDPSLRMWNNDSLGQFQEATKGHRAGNQKEDHIQPDPDSSRSIVISLVTIAVLVAAILGYFAWEKSESSPGRLNSSGFWSVCQSSLMQILEASAFVLVDMRQQILPHSTRAWAWGLGVASAVVTLSSIPLYVYASPRWSAMFAFAGGVGQMIFTVQLPLAWVESSGGRKRKDKTQ